MLFPSFLIYATLAAVSSTANAKQIQTCRDFGEVSYEIYEEADKVISFGEKCVAKRFTSFKICEDGGWNEICDSNFTKSDATVMCRELGYSDIGVQMYEFPQYIGVTKMSSRYPECNGKESSLSTCLVQHHDASVLCSAKRVVVVCFPVTMDPQTDLPLCGFKPSPTTLTQDSTITLAESSLTEDVAASLLITNGSYSGFSRLSSDFILILVTLGFAAVQLSGLQHC